MTLVNVTGISKVVITVGNLFSKAVTDTVIVVLGKVKTEVTVTIDKGVVAVVAVVFTGVVVTDDIDDNVVVVNVVTSAASAELIANVSIANFI